MKLKRPKLLGREIILRERQENQIGFVPTRNRSEKYRKRFNINKRPGELKIIESNISSWSEVTNSEAQRFAFAPGDYRHLGVLELKDRKDLTFYLMTGIDGKNPAHIGVTNMAILEAVELRNCEGLTFQGLTHSGVGKTIQGVIAGIGSTVRDCNNIIWDNCLFENPANGLFRIVNSNYCTFQDCVVRRAPKIRGDRSGIGFQATRDSESRGNVVVNCEFYDLTDGIGTPASYRPGTMPGPNDLVGPVPGLVIYGNHFYLTEYSYPDPVGRLTACAENALDFKVGGTSWEEGDYVLVENNIMHGYRPTDQECGGTGDAGGCITVHRNTKYLQITGNVMFDSGYGVAVYPEKDDYPAEKVHDIQVVNNLFHRMVDAAGNTTVNGIALRSAVEDTVFWNNTVIDAAVPYFRKANTTLLANGNVYLNTGKLNDPNDQRAFYGSLAIDGLADYRIKRFRVASLSSEEVDVPVFYGAAPTNERNYKLE